jgi:hypothetical protein
MNSTPRAEMTARPGKGYSLRETFVQQGLGRLTSEYREITGE